MSVPPGAISSNTQSFRLAGLNIPPFYVPDYDVTLTSYVMRINSNPNTSPPLLDERFRYEVTKLLDAFYWRIAGTPGGFQDKLNYATVQGDRIIQFLNSLGVLRSGGRFDYKSVTIVGRPGELALAVIPAFTLRSIEISTQSVDSLNTLGGYDTKYILVTKNWAQYLPAEGSLVQGNNLASRSIKTNQIEQPINSGYLTLRTTVNIEDKINNLTQFSVDVDTATNNLIYYDSLPEPNLALNILPKVYSHCDKQQCKKCWKKHIKKIRCQKKTTAPNLLDMVSSIASIAQKVALGTSTFNEGKTLIEQALNARNDFLTDGTAMFYLENTDKGLEFIYCARYNLEENDCVVSFSLNEIKDIQDVNMNVSSVPVTNNLSEAVYPSYQPVSYHVDNYE